MAPSVYDVITARIIEKLEAGCVPWRKPWNAETGAPRNIRGTFYRGVNVFLLGCQSYSDPRWLTFNQARALGGSVRKGERATPVVFWKWLDVMDPGTKGTERVPMLRYYSVFNVEQTDGLNLPTLEKPAREHQPIEACERIAKGYTGGPSLIQGGGVACYSPSSDIVRMPQPESFTDPESYYSVLYHELAHSTGHRSRLARDGVVNPVRFASHDYSREELVAEMCAAFLAGTAGIEPKTLDNSASYIASWLRVLRKDNRAVVIAAGQAQRAADWILGMRRTEEHEAPLLNAA